MKRDFIEKLNNHEYISRYLYLNTPKEDIPLDFDIDKYNNMVLDAKMSEYKDYFDNMYKEVDPNVKLDEEQIRAILADEDYALIIAGAGTGKTTTMVSKVKYLVDIEKVDAKKILVMSFTKKATGELKKRLVDDFDLEEVDVKTFHALGFDIIRKICKEKHPNPMVVDSNLKYNIFLDWFIKLFNDKVKREEFFKAFINVESRYSISLFTNNLKDNYMKYETYDEYFKAYKEKKISETKEIKEKVDKIINHMLNQDEPRTIRGELVKSRGEAVIANYLYMHNIDYKYEKIYEEIFPDDKLYEPDFTLDVGGEAIYIEYFGLTGEKYYDKIKEKKIIFHQNNHNTLIAIDRKNIDDIPLELEEKLSEHMVINNEISYEEVYDKLLDNTAKLREVRKLQMLFYDIIKKIKASDNRQKYREIVWDNINGDPDSSNRKIEFKYFDSFYKYYQSRLYAGVKYAFDYEDMIYYAVKAIRNAEIPQYEYIIIDEFQDVSLERYKLARSTANKTGSKVIAVGDDWQTIYSFSGSKIEFIYKFEEFFNGAKKFVINTTYRNPVRIVDTSGKFIMKNYMQIKKKLISHKDIDNPIRFVEFDSSKYNKDIDVINSDDDDDYNSNKEIRKPSEAVIAKFAEMDRLKELIREIHAENPEDNILILARNNYDINTLFKDEFFKDDIGTKIKITSYNDMNIDGMTIHKAKGLTADQVIIIGTNKLPPKERDEYWLDRLFKNPEPTEGILHPEERRVFYVALTRTKNNVYILVNKHPKFASKFVDEIKELYETGE